MERRMPHSPFVACSMPTPPALLNRQRKVANTRRKVARIPKERYYFDYAKTEEQCRKAFALRYRVFCLEHGFLCHKQFPDQLQTDVFDSAVSTKHILGFCSGQEGDVCGTMRVIRDPQNPRFASPDVPVLERRDHKLPMESHYPFKFFREQARNIEQVTSLACRKGVSEQMYFGLCKSIYWDAVNHGVDDIFIQANPSLAWLFEAIGFKELYAAEHSINMHKDPVSHRNIPVIGMHLDMCRIADEFLTYFHSPDPRFLFHQWDRQFA